MRPPVPQNEPDRLAALRSFGLLDTEPDRVFDSCTRLVARYFDTPIALVSLVDERRQWFKSRIGLTAAETPRESSFCAHAINGSDVLVIEDAMADIRFRDNPLVTGDPNIRFYAGALLKTTDGLSLGTLCVIDDKPRPTPSADDLDFLKMLARVLMVEVEARLSVGYLDAVTRLPNRYRLMEEFDQQIEQLVHNEERLTVIVVESITLARMNDLVASLGHGYLDAYVLAMAKRLLQVVPQAWRLYHMGVTRFAIMVKEPTLEFEHALWQFTDNLAEPLLCNGIPMRETAGVGVAHYPDDGSSSIELLRAATGAASESASRAIRWKRYDRERDVSRKRANQLLSALPFAIETEDQFHLVYQPKLDLRTGQCAGAEALLRWVHPDFGPVSPGEFIPIAERTALVSRITNQVISAAISQVAEWREAGIALQISINVSARDFEHSGLLMKLTDSLDRHRVDPESLQIEVTEGGLMRNMNAARGQLDLIRQVGVSIAIDDYGTGQSSIGYLKQIPADVLKIDQEFIRSVTTERSDQIIVRSTIDLAHELGLSIVAEGIETAADYEWLAANGCEFGQGYYIGRPMTPDAFLEWLKGQPCRLRGGGA